MENQDIWSIILSIASIGIGVIAIVNEKDRVLIISLFSLFITGYFLYNMYTKIDNHSEDIRKINEKLKIHEQLIEIKADIRVLKEKIKNE
ncbi:hypothetical protein HYT57_01700 [Candidatus Woesearchaeota archaeon]|nr:hypothetical protein [Candidatus Woesearchaeota archaeon]